MHFWGLRFFPQIFLCVKSMIFRKSVYEVIMQRGGRATKRVMVCHLMIMKNTGVLGDSEVNSSHYNTLEQSKTKDPNIKAGKLSPK